MKRDIAIIVPYFGTLPIWFDLFLYSCSKNQMLEYLFFTDCETPAVVYENTKFINTSFKDYCLRVSLALGINFSPQSPYKLCDLKPFYGIIHQRELHDYSFWGFGDVDLIYGDLSLVLSDKRLKLFDLITTHDDRVAGHFTVIRKESKYTNMGLHIKDYKAKLENPAHVALDEDDYTYLAYPQLRMLERIYRRVVKPFGIWHKKYFKLLNPLFCNRWTKISFVEYFTTEVPHESEEWRYDTDTGIIKKLPVDKELPYLHFLFFKKTQYLETNNYWQDHYYKVPNLKDIMGQHLNIRITIDGIEVCDE